MFHTKVAETNTRFMISYFFFVLESRAVYEITWKNMEQPDRPQIPIQYGARTNMLDTYGYRHTLRICNTYCSSTATMATRTRLNDKLYVHYQSS